jgi:hypothetical protein
MKNNTKSLNLALILAQETLNIWSNQKDILELLIQAFGNNIDNNEAKTIIKNWTDKNFKNFNDFLKIEVLSV